jgi:hypothetical protein
MLKSLILIALVIVAIFVTPWAWIGVLLIALWKWRIWYRYNGRPWRKVHFNAMIYAAEALAHERLRELKGNEFSYRNVCIEMVRSLKGLGFDVGENVEVFVDRQLAEYQDPYFMEHLATGYIVRAKNISSQKANELIKNVCNQNDLNDNYFKLRAVVAGVVERVYSESDRGEYWYEVLNGKAV